MNCFTCKQWILERTPDLSERKITGALDDGHLPPRVAP